MRSKLNAVLQNM